MRKRKYIFLITVLIVNGVYSQDTTHVVKQDTTHVVKQDTTSRISKQDSTDISKLLDEQLITEYKNKTEYVTATFKTTRLVNGHTIETTGKGVLDVKISHRFNPISDRFIGGGAYNFFGLDHATMRMGFDYGLTNTLMIGIGRSTLQKTFDALIKWKILRQSTGKAKMPVTMDYVGTLGLRSENPSDSLVKAGFTRYFTNRLSFTHQLIIGRKFSENLSLQIMPTLVHRNYPMDNEVQGQDAENGKNDIWAFGIGGRQKLSKRTSFNFEYYYQLPGSKVPGTRNSFSIGFDIETGGHVFQIHLTNAQGMTESLFIPGTIQSWAKGEICLGFNLSRVFTVSKRH